MITKITRREFSIKSAATAAALALHPLMSMGIDLQIQTRIRLGGPVFIRYEGPDEWINELVNLGYRAAYCPVDTSAGQDEIRAYREAANKADIIIREDIGTPHLSELRPGLGKLDYNVFLKELSKLKNVPLMIEHLQTAEEYRLAAEAGNPGVQISLLSHPYQLSIPSPVFTESSMN